MNGSSDPTRCLEAVHHWHLAVHQNQVEIPFDHRLDGLGAIGDCGGLVSELLKLRQTHVPIGGIVFGQPAGALRR